MEITTFDRELMLWLNFDGGAVLDSVMWFISAKAAWVPLYLFCLWVIGRRWGFKYALIILLAAVVGVVLSDHICNFFKHNFQMLRPYRVEGLKEQIHTIINPLTGAPYSCGRYGTASGHAATTMAIMLTVGHALRDRRWYWWVMGTVVVLVAYSRIYIGVHFPSQIALGWTVGAVVGYIIVRLLTRFFDRYREGSLTSNV